MRLVVSRHRQDRHLSNRALRPMQPSRPLVDRCKVRAHVARVATSSRDLFSSRRYLPQRLCIVRHVCKNDQHMVSLLDRKVFCGCESQSRCQYSLDCRVVCKVDEHRHVVKGALFLKIVSEEAKLVCCYAHRGKYRSERLIRATDLCLSGDLGCDAVVG